MMHGQNNIKLVTYLSTWQLVKSRSLRIVLPIFHRLTCVFCDVELQLLQPLDCPLSIVRCDVWKVAGIHKSFLCIVTPYILVITDDMPKKPL